jgi:DNA-binding IclR family transcriptional regulator
MKENLDAIAVPVLDHRRDLVASLAAAGSSGGLDIFRFRSCRRRTEASAKRFAQLIG